LKKPFSPTPTIMFTVPRVFPKHIWENIMERENIKSPHEYPNLKPIGSGPFKLVYWRRGEEFKCVRNEDYFNPPKINGFIYHNYSHQDGVLLALEKGEADVNLRELLTDLALQAKKMSHLTDVSLPQLRVDILGYHCQTGPFKGVSSEEH